MKLSNHENNAKSLEPDEPTRASRLTSDDEAEQRPEQCEDRCSVMTRSRLTMKLSNYENNAKSHEPDEPTHASRLTMKLSNHENNAKSLKPDETHASRLTSHDEAATLRTK